MKKRIVCLVLSLVLVLGCTTAAFAKSETTLPVIMVTGYASGNLYTNYGTAQQSKVWNTIGDDLPSLLIKDLPNVMLALIKTFFGNPQALGDEVGKLIAVSASGTVCNPDGTSKNAVTTYPNEPARCTFSYLTDENAGQDMAEWDYAKDIAAEYGGDKVFFFHSDFRMGAIDNAECLNDFVNKVTEYTGESKVKIFALSHGGQVTGTFLSLHGTEGKVDRAVMAMPALCGTDVAYDVLTGNVTIADRDLIGYLETALCSTILSSPLGIVKLFKSDSGFAGLDKIAVGAMKALNPIVKYWTSLWDFLPTDKYEQLKSTMLDSTANAKIIADSDRMHYEIMPNYADAFKACQDSGVEVSILSGMGLGVALGSDADSDCIINTACATGANCARLGNRFTKEYTPKGTTCSNAEHNHISPDFTVDASCAFLPENTWFVKGLYHGMYYFEDYTLSLVNKLMFTEEIKDIYSSADYPQFTTSGHSYLGVNAMVQGGKLTVKNNTQSKIILLGIKGDFTFKGITAINAGDSVSFDLAKSSDSLHLEISYFRLGAFSPLNTREITIKG